MLIQYVQFNFCRTRIENITIISYGRFHELKLFIYYNISIKWLSNLHTIKRYFMRTNKLIFNTLSVHFKGKGVI